MTNNDVLKKIRYIYDLKDSQLIDIFWLGEEIVTAEQIENWTSKDDSPNYIGLIDKSLAAFLNGFIIKMRGPKDGEKPIAEKKLNNNIILRKIKIALNFKDTDIINTLDKADIRVGKAEIAAFFRNPKHQHYRICKDQFMRNFLYGLQLTLKPKEDKPTKETTREKTSFAKTEKSQ